MMKYLKCTFVILAVIFFSYFIFGQILLPADTSGLKGICQEYNESIVAIDKAGNKTTRESISRTDGLKGVEVVLPQDLDPQTNAFCFGGRKIRAYVDDQFIYKSPSDFIGWFSQYAPEHFIMIPISASDAGKTLRIEFDYDSGVLYQMYIGTEIGIWFYILGDYAGELLVAALTLVLGILTIIASIIYGIISKKKIDIAYLGAGVSFAAIWLVVNSVYRQVICSNLSTASDFPFLMVMLIPFPFLIYMNGIQNRRFEKFYLTAGFVLVAVDVVNCTLFAAGIKGLVDTFIFVALACLLAIFTVIYSFVIDMKNGRLKEYRYVAFGLFCAFSLAVIQIITYFFRTGVFSGVYLAMGLLGLLISSIIHTIHSVFGIEKDKQAAVMASDAKGRFLSEMSHEIRTPINAILGMDEMILREATEPHIRDYALDIQNAGKSLLVLINDILDISKIESGKMEIINTEYDMSSLLNDTMNMIYNKATEKGLYSKINVETSMPSRLIGDDLRIRQVLINILNNAVKYTHQGGVTLDVTGDIIDEGKILLHFKIIDTGIGIKDEDLPKLYASFERIEEDKNREVEGTGLGMSITLHLLELMSSKLDVESEYGKGSCFYFDLEQEIADPTPIGNLSERISEQRLEYNYQSTFSVRDGDILVVDDNAVNRKVIRNFLKDTGIMIHEADSGEKCLDMICERPFDLIFLDHMMPGLDGIETLMASKTKEDNKNINTPVVMLTANAITGAREMYLNAGFDDFLTKPVAYGKLENILLEYLPQDKIIIGTPNESQNEDSIEKRRLLEEIPEMNVDYALMINSGIDAAYDTLIDFTKTIESEIKDLNHFKDMLPGEEPCKQYRVKVHAIKSSALLVGQMYLSGMARMLEVAAINKDYSLIDAVHDTFISELLNKKHQCESLIPEDIEGDLVEANMALVEEQLQLLVTAVKDVDVDRADEIVTLLKGFDYPQEKAAIMESIYSAVMNLDENIIIEEMKKL